MRNSRITLGLLVLFLLMITLVSLRNLDVAAPTGSIHSPINNSILTDLNQTIIANVSDNIDLYSSELLIWENGSLVTQSQIINLSEGKLWVVNQDSYSITKIFQNLTMINYTIDGYPHYIGYDGTDLWIPSYSGNGVDRLNTTNGNYHSIGSSGEFSSPTSVAYDNHSAVWIANGNETYGGVTKVDINTEAVTRYTNNFPNVGYNAYEIAYGGDFIWVGFYGGSCQENGKIYKVNISDGSASEFATTNSCPTGIYYINNYLWVVNNKNSTIQKFNVANGNEVAEYKGIVRNATKITFDGTNIWTASESDQMLSKISVANGTIWNYTGIGKGAYGIAWDGNYIWTANRDSNSISRFNPETFVVNNYTGVGIKPRAIISDNVILPLQQQSISLINYMSGQTNTTSWDYTFSDYGNYTIGLKTCDSSNNCQFSENITVKIESNQHITSHFLNISNNMWSANIDDSATKILLNKTSFTHIGMGSYPHDIVWGGDRFAIPQYTGGDLTFLFSNGTRVNCDLNTMGYAVNVDYNNNTDIFYVLMSNPNKVLEVTKSCVVTSYTWGGQSARGLKYNPFTNKVIVAQSGILGFVNVSNHVFTNLTGIPSNPENLDIDFEETWIVFDNNVTANVNSNNIITLYNGTGVNSRDILVLPDYVWTSASTGLNYLSKLNKQTGEITKCKGTGLFPYGLFYHPYFGTIWSANVQSDSISEVTNDCQITNHSITGHKPHNLAYEGILSYHIFNRSI